MDTLFMCRCKNGETHVLNAAVLKQCTLLKVSNLSEIISIDIDIDILDLIVIWSNYHAIHTDQIDEIDHIVSPYNQWYLSYFSQIPLQKIVLLIQACQNLGVISLLQYCEFRFPDFYNRLALMETELIFNNLSL